MFKWTLKARSGKCVRATVENSVNSRVLIAASGVALLAIASHEVRASTIATNVPDMTLRWDNTIKYSAAFRLKNPSSELVAPTGGFNVNMDDGDRNFDSGLISNRLDILSEMDFSYRNFGARVSGAGWYDTVYNQHTDNDSAATYNASSVGNNKFTDDTRDLQGRKAEVLDAFFYGRFDLGDHALSVRLGQYSLLWGESLFFGDNGIAGTQAPIDVVKLLSVPNTQFKELIRPTQQLSAQFSLTPTVSVAAYYQMDWERNRIPASGSYFSRVDIFDDGGERFIVGAPLCSGVGSPAPGSDVPSAACTGASGPLAFFRGRDREAEDSGQWGAQLRWRSEALDTDFGFYAVNFHDKNFQVYLNQDDGSQATTTGQIGTYQLVFAENIKAYGTSFSKSIGSANVAGEFSIRRNTPLVATAGTIDVTGTAADNDNHPMYPVGNSAHAQLSTVISLSPISGLWDGGFLLAEVAWNRRTSIDDNAAQLDPNTTRDATALRLLFLPARYQALPGVDLTVPIGLGYNPGGRSSVISVWNGGWSHGGDLSVGLTAEYLQTWKGGINYTRYLGSQGTILDAASEYSFDQSFKDRDFISVSLQRTF